MRLRRPVFVLCLLVVLSGLLSSCGIEVHPKGQVVAGVGVGSDR